MYVIFPGPGWDTAYSTKTYKFEGDTVINNLTYLKVYKSNEEMPMNWTFEGCIRENQNKKVFFRKWDTDYLKYDFGVELGDTIEVYVNNYAVQVRVESIDSLYVNGSYRKTILLKNVMDYTIYEKWIEGIGSLRGILESGTAGFVGGWRWFLCMSQNGELIYMNPNYNSCYLISTDIDEIKKSSIQINPNPVKGKIRIENTEDIRIESISIIDLKGKKIMEFEKSKTELDLSGISTGIYLLKLSYENGEVIRKIMIE